MNKETRIFIVGFFWFFIGGFVVAHMMIEMINGTWKHVWYNYVCLVWGIYMGIDGLIKIKKTT